MIVNERNVNELKSGDDVTIFFKTQNTFLARNCTILEVSLLYEVISLQSKKGKKKVFSFPFAKLGIGEDPIYRFLVFGTLSIEDARKDEEINFLMKKIQKEYNQPDDLRVISIRDFMNLKNGDKFTAFYKYNTGWKGEKRTFSSFNNETLTIKSVWVKTKRLDSIPFEKYIYIKGWGTVKNKNLESFLEQYYSSDTYDFKRWDGSLKFLEYRVINNPKKIRKDDEVTLFSFEKQENKYEWIHKGVYKFCHLNEDYFVFTQVWPSSVSYAPFRFSFEKLLLSDQKQIWIFGFVPHLNSEEMKKIKEIGDGRPEIQFLLFKEAEKNDAKSTSENGVKNLIEQRCIEDIKKLKLGDLVTIFNYHDGMWGSRELRVQSINLNSSISFTTTVLPKTTFTYQEKMFKEPTFICISGSVPKNFNLWNLDDICRERSNIHNNDGILVEKTAWSEITATANLLGNQTHQDSQVDEISKKLWINKDNVHQLKTDDIFIIFENINDKWFHLAACKVLCKKNEEIFGYLDIVNNNNFEFNNSPALIPSAFFTKSSFICLRASFLEKDKDKILKNIEELAKDQVKQENKEKEEVLQEEIKIPEVENKEINFFLGKIFLSRNPNMKAISDRTTISSSVSSTEDGLIAITISGKSQHGSISLHPVEVILKVKEVKKLPVSKDLIYSRVKDIYFLLSQKKEEEAAELISSSFGIEISEAVDILADGSWLFRMTETNK